MAWQISPTPTMARLLNLALHILAGIVLFRMSRRILPPLGAGVAGAFFLLHPTHGEVISFAVGRADVLAFLFMAACFELYLRKRNTAALVVFFFGLLAKESAMLVAVPIGVHALASGRWRSVLDIVRGAAPYAAIVIFNYLLHYQVTGLWTQAGDILTNPLVAADPLTSVVHMAAFPTWYLDRLLWPMHYPADFCAGSFHVRSLSDPELWISAISSAGFFCMALLLALRSEKWRASGIGLGLYFALGMIAFQWLGKGSFIMADRLIYASCAGLAIVLGSVAAELETRLREIQKVSRLLPLLPAAVLLAYAAAGLFNTIPAFSGSLQLAQAQLENTPGSARAYHMLGNAWSMRGDYQKGFEYFSKADEAHPGYPRYQLGVAKALSELGRNDEAEEILKYLFRQTYNPEEDIGFSYALLLWKTDRPAEAEAVLKDVAGNNPYSFKTHFELSRVIYAQGRFEESLTLLEKACRMPDFIADICMRQMAIVRRDLIKSLLEKGEIEKALRELEVERSFDLPEKDSKEIKDMIDGYRKDE